MVVKGEKSSSSYHEELGSGSACLEVMLLGEGCWEERLRAELGSPRALFTRRFLSLVLWVPRKHSKKLINFLSSAATVPANTVWRSEERRALPFCSGSSPLSYSDSYFVLAKMKCQGVTEKNTLLMLSSNWVFKVRGSGGNGESWDRGSWDHTRLIRTPNEASYVMCCAIHHCHTDSGRFGSELTCLLLDLLHPSGCCQMRWGEVTGVRCPPLLHPG